MTESVARLRGEQLTLGYGKYTVAENLTVEIPDGHFTAIIGPNGCGKSTLLRTLSRLMTPAHGHVWLDGEHIQHYASKEVARRIGLLAQNATTPGDITVQERRLRLAPGEQLAVVDEQRIGCFFLRIDRQRAVRFGDRQPGLGRRVA